MKAPMFKIDTEKLYFDRGNLGLTLKEVAEATDLDVRTISRVESGVIVPRLDTLGKIAKAYGKTAEYYKVKD